jgi:rhodanese-related sulfurtransferase
MTTIAPKQLHELRTSGTACVCIDVRTPVEHREVHAEGVTLLPLDQLHVDRIRELATDGTSVYLFCRSGGRASKAQAQLTAAGLTNCIVVEGGTDAWAAAGLPVVRGKKAMSLERQVRIAAGALVLTGVVLALTVHPYAIALSGFIGAGLIFAGITDWCGMGMVIAKMPWNKVTPSCAVKSSTTSTNQA